MGRRPTGSPGQKRTGESPPSGIAGGPAETWTRVELGPHLAYRKSECWKLSAYSCARRRSIPTFARRRPMGRSIVRGTGLLVVLTVLVLPLVATAQRPAQVRRIAFLGLNFPPSASAPTPFLDAFRDGLRERGWVEGHNL